MYLKKNNKIVWGFDPVIFKKKLNDICKIYNIHPNIVRFYSLEYIDVYIVQHFLKKKIKDGNILEILSNKHTFKSPKHIDTLVYGNGYSNIIHFCDKFVDVSSNNSNKKKEKKNNKKKNKKRNNKKKKTKRNNKKKKTKKKKKKKNTKKNKKKK